MTQSIIIPNTYSITHACDIVLQMKKSIDHMITIGNYYSFIQFKMPRYCSKQIKNIGDGIRVITIRRNKQIKAIQELDMDYET